MSKAMVLQLDYELGDHAMFGSTEVQVIAVTYHISGAVLYHVGWFDSDDDYCEAIVAGAQLH